jgi:hypothetical protein
MSMILYAVGAVAALAGLAMVGFGIPVNEFSFGNTLILAGVTAITGGLIIAALGAVVAQLQKLNQQREIPLGGRDLAARNRIPFPPKPAADAPRSGYLSEPRVALEQPPSPMPESQENPAPYSFVPTLRNPEETEVAVEEEVSLSPRHPFAPQAPAMEPGESGHDEPMLDAGWRPSPRSAPVAPPHHSQSTYFDAMWPDPKAAPEAESRHSDNIGPSSAAQEWPSSPIQDSSYGAVPETPYSSSPEPAEPVADMADPEPRAEPEAPAREAQTVAILKSGVVDGMGYTLYVDGSIEAELPQGTLRFASINELRSHLEKNA